MALRGVGGAVSYAELAAAVHQAADHLQGSASRVIGLAMDNGPLWSVVDLAAMQAGIPTVPLPFFFSAAQLLHAIRDAGIDCLYTDQPELYQKLLEAGGVDILSRFECLFLGQTVVELRLRCTEIRLPAGTAKVTYTSGTTGNPKGVCLGLAAITQVALSLQKATAARPDDRHVSVLPLPTLLENIAGLYVPLLAGATCTLLPFAEVGLKGGSGLDVQKMTGALVQYEATSTILTPELLRALVATVAAGHLLPAHLRFVAVGGAPVAKGLLDQAHAFGIPVFEGYGLSECASVVALNTENASCIGSVGKPLPHVQLKFAEDDEILVGGATLLGYTGQGGNEVTPEYWPTGDCGYVDEAGYLHITGRKKNIFITSYGRNVAPEWVERELMLYPCIAQAAVFGESRPWNVAVIVARGSGNEQEIERAIADANSRLPDYARVRRWIHADAPFTPLNGQATSNGRLRRDAIRAAYQTHMNNLYEETTDVVL
jgi:long-subunit acyl-CoA synthetase (AMP-forming)